MKCCLRLKEKPKAGVILPKLDTSIIFPTIHKEGSEQRRPSRSITGVCEPDTRDSRDMASVRDVQSTETQDGLLERDLNTAPSLMINCQLTWAWLNTER